MGTMEDDSTLRTAENAYPTVNNVLYVPPMIVRQRTLAPMPVHSHHKVSQLITTLQCTHSMASSGNHW